VTSEPRNPIDRMTPNPTRPKLDALIPKIYEELRSLAAAALSNERHAQTLRPTALVHEAYERLATQRQLEVTDRGKFFAAAANVMRRVLIDHARARGAEKRGGDSQSITLDTRIAGEEPEAPTSAFPELMDLESAMTALELVHGRAARVVELRFFAGLTAPEAAAALDVSERLVFDDWSFARAFLHRELSRNAKIEGTPRSA